MAETSMPYEPTTKEKVKEKYGRIMLITEIDFLFNEALQKSFPPYLEDELCVCEPLEGALKEYGDYQCTNIFSICEKLRAKNPNLFEKEESGPKYIAEVNSRTRDIAELRCGPKDIAKVIRSNFRKSDMIKELIPHDIGILTFKLDGLWMAKRIYNNLNDGIAAWAPISRAKKVIVDFSTPDPAAKMHADGVRSRYIKDTLVHMLEYSGAKMIDREITEEDRRKVKEACEEAHEFSDDDHVTLRCGIDKQVDWIVFVTPVRQREYIMKRFDAASRLLKGHSTTMSYLGYHTSSNEQGKLASFKKEYEGSDKAKKRVKKVLDEYESCPFGEKEVFEGYVKYAYLKKNRFSDCTFSVKDMLDEKENNFVNLLKTQALICSAIKDCGRKVEKEVNEIEAFVNIHRELGVQLLQFTEVIEESFLTFMPHLVCEYVWNLSKNVTSYLEKVKRRVTNTKKLLCIATEAVIEKCFDILGITSEYLKQHTFPVSDAVPVDVAVSPVDAVPDSDAVAVSNARIRRGNSWGKRKQTRSSRLGKSIAAKVQNKGARVGAKKWPESPTSRFELFSMFIGVSHSNFDKGNLFGNITLSDTYGLLSDGWCKMDENDCGHVAYFDHDWHDSVGIYSTSFLSFGNPSSRHSVPFSSSIEIGVHLFVTTEENDACYQLCNYEHKINLSQFLDGEQSIQPRTFNVKGNDGSVSIYYVLLEEAQDISIKLECYKLVEDKKVCGRILAYYGGNFLNSCDGFEKESYKALIFHIEPHDKLERGDLPLKKSRLAVPTNGFLMIEAFLEDVDSGDVILNDTYIYHAEDEHENFEMSGENYVFILEVDWIGVETELVGGDGAIEETAAGSSSQSSEKKKSQE